MTDTLIPAEAFPPGEFLRDELAERGWAEGEFAEIIGRPAQTVSEILNGKKEITPETAVAIGAALGTSAELWMNLQAGYQLHKLRSAERPTVRPVERRARLRSLLPVRELQKRGWLPLTDNLDVLEASVCDLLRIESVTDEPQFAAAARRSNANASFTPEQVAWIARVEQSGCNRVDTAFNKTALTTLARDLAQRIKGPSDLGLLPKWLAECGVALVVELPLRNSKLDGIASMSTGTPIIGLSTRGDRMDSFVFTLLHEVAHLALDHVPTGKVTIDEEIDLEGQDGIEKVASEQASNWIFKRQPRSPAGDLTPRILRDLADEHEVHVSLLIGRFQHMGVLDWSDYRRAIPKVRPFVEIG